MADKIGIIGLGDLGAKLARQLMMAGHTVMAFEIDPQRQQAALEAVDPRLVVDTARGRLSLVPAIEQVLQSCDIVHWVVPSAKLDLLPMVSTDQLVVLHDSVMASSVAALQTRRDHTQFVIAHCLMNANRRVLISDQYGDNDLIVEHLRDIGLAPKYITVKQHDVLMARTQGVFALLIKLGIRAELDEGFTNGNLTPSALELRSAVTDREARWTAQTLQSILDNPELGPFAKEIASALHLKSD